MTNYKTSTTEHLEVLLQHLESIGHDPQADSFCLHIQHKKPEEVIDACIDTTVSFLTNLDVEWQLLLCEETKDIIIVSDDISPVLVMHLLGVLDDVWGARNVALYHAWEDREVLKRIIGRIIAEYRFLESSLTDGEAAADKKPGSKATVIPFAAAYHKERQQEKDEQIAAD